MEGKNRTEILIIVGSASDVQEIEDYARLLLPSGNGSPGLIGIGSGTNLKNEITGFTGLSGVLVGTPDRIIDHLRRDNIDLKDIGRVLIDCPVEKDLTGFIADVEFIYSRTGIKPVTIVLTERLCDDCLGLARMLRRPKVLPHSTWRKTTPQYRLYMHTSEIDTNQAILRILREQKKNEKCLIILKDTETADALGILISENGHIPGTVEITDSTTQDFPYSEELGTILFGYAPASIEVSRASLCIDDSRKSSKILFVIDENEYPTLSALQENMKVSMKKSDIPGDNADLKNYIADIVEKIKNEEDPHELSFYKKQINKNVSIFLRGYFTAYLLKQITESASSGRKRRPTVLRNMTRQDMVTLFFGLGKNRKVFPRDITGLISSLPEIDDPQIGEMKILDNYSFVDVAAAQAPAIIEKLNGIEFRGRKIIVNFARKKDNSRDA